MNLSLDAGRKQAQDPHYRFVSGVKFTQWEGSVVIHCKKNGPALQRRHSLCHCLSQGKDSPWFLRCPVGGLIFSQRESSMLIYRKKNTCLMCTKILQIYVVGLLVWC